MTAYTQDLTAELRFNDYSAAVIADGALSYWKCDDTSNPAVDAKGVANASETRTNFTTWNSPGGVKNGFVKTGSFCALQISSTSLYQFTGTASFTWECWVKHHPDKIQLLMFTDTGSTNGIQIKNREWYSSAPVLRRQSKTVDSSVSVVSGAWNHIVATYDGATLRLYVNGQAAGSIAATDSVVASSRFTFCNEVGGWDLSDPGNRNPGMDEVAVYSNVLTAAQIAEHYRLGAIVLSKRTIPAKAGALSFSGSWAWQRLRILTASLGLSGAVAKTAARALSGGLTFQGDFAGVANKAFAASLDFATSIVRGISKVLTADLGLSGQLAKTAQTAFTAALSFSGALANKTARTLQGSLSFVGNLTKQAPMGLTAGLSFTGSLARQGGKSLDAVLSTTGAFAKAARRTMTGALSFGGSLDTILFAFWKQFTASISFSSGMSKRTSRALSGAVSFGGALLQRFVWLQIQLSTLPRYVTLGHFRQRFPTMLWKSQYNVQIRVVGPQEMAYKRGTNVLFEATFTDKDGVVFDPDAGTAKLYAKKPDGTYMTGLDPATGGRLMTAVAVGVYQADVQFARTDPVGRYTIEAEGKVGTKTFLDDAQIQVKA